MELIYILWSEKYISLLENGYEYNECAAITTQDVIELHKQKICKIKSGQTNVSVSDVNNLFEAYEELLIENKHLI